MSIDPLEDLARFHKGYNVAESGCWEWVKCKDVNGYGMIGVGSRVNKSFKVARAHKWAYEMLVGLVPDGMELDHLCRNRHCVNPSHLEPVSHKENIRRGINLNRERFMCVAGHPLSGDNLYLAPSGKRQCKECQRRRSREYGKRTNWSAAKRYREQAANA